MERSFSNRESVEKPCCASYWDTPERARDYLKNYGIESDPEGRRSVLLSRLNLSPIQNVLEIGPGPGVYTIPIARQVRHVTAVEPSSGMSAVLEDRIESERVKNITIIQNRWEDTDTSETGTDYDLVLASFSLGMPDIKEAVTKMVSVCKGRVVLYWHTDTPQFELLYSMVWPSLYGKEYIPGPKSDILFNVLYQMGIYPSVEYIDHHQTQVFSSYQELQKYFFCQHYLEYDPEEPAFQQYLENYVEQKNGQLIHHERLPGMVFQWNVQ